MIEKIKPLKFFFLFVWLPTNLIAQPIPRNGSAEFEDPGTFDVRGAQESSPNVYINNFTYFGSSGSQGYGGSRYSTGQGWSRGNSGYYWNANDRNSDIAQTPYNTPIDTYNSHRGRYRNPRSGHNDFHRGHHNFNSRGCRSR